MLTSSLCAVPTRSERLKHANFPVEKTVFISFIFQYTASTESYQGAQFFKASLPVLAVSKCSFSGSSTAKIRRQIQLHRK